MHVALHLILLLLAVAVSAVSAFSSQKSREGGAAVDNDDSDNSLCTDFAVISPGGVGSTSFNSFVDKQHVRTNQGRMKHSGPHDFIGNDGVTVKRGFIYLAGDIFSSIRSIIRRHYTQSHTRVLHGDMVWIREQVHSLDLHSALFLPVVAGKSQDVTLCRRHGVTPDDLMKDRLYKILIYIHKHGHDPIGLWKHFTVWRDAATHSLLPGPIVFVSLHSLAQNQVVNDALKLLLNKTDTHKFLAYKPKEYREYLSMYRNLTTITSVEKSQIVLPFSSNILDMIINGSKVLQHLSHSIESFIVLSSTHFANKTYIEVITTFVK